MSLLQDFEREGEALKLRLDETEDEEDEDENKEEEVVDGIPTIQTKPARIQIVETEVVKPRKPSLVHLNTPDMLDIKTQRRWVNYTARLNNI